MKEYGTKNPAKVKMVRPAHVRHRGLKNEHKEGSFKSIYGTFRIPKGKESKGKARACKASWLENTQCVRSKS